MSKKARSLAGYFCTSQAVFHRFFQTRVVFGYGAKKWYRGTLQSTIEKWYLIMVLTIVCLLHVFVERKCRHPHWHRCYLEWMTKYRSAVRIRGCGGDKNFHDHGGGLARQTLKNEGHPRKNRCYRSDVVERGYRRCNKQVQPTKPIKRM